MTSGRTSRDPNATSSAVPTESSAENAKTGESAQPKPSIRMQYALRTAVLGNLVSGKRGQAREVWSSYGASAFRDPQPPLDVRLMLTLDDPAAYEAWRSLFTSNTPVVATR